MLHIVSNLKGYGIEAKDGSIGTASDFLFDDSSLKIRWLVVDTGNWLTGRKVLIHPSAIGYADHLRRELTVGLTRSQVKDSPDIDQDQPVSLQMQKDLYKYYGWESSAGVNIYGAGVYGGGSYGADVGMIAPPVPARTYFGANQAGEAHREKTTTHDDDPHLRSIAEVTGYQVHATDGSIGHVENFLVDSKSWVVRYLIIDTSNWWFGQHVLISPHAVKEIDWTARFIRLDIARVQVRASPPWNPAVPIDEEFEDRLYSHYEWPSSEGTSVFDGQ